VAMVGLDYLKCNIDGAAHGNLGLAAFGILCGRKGEFGGGGGGVFFFFC